MESTPNSNPLPNEQKSVIDELDSITDENEKFWKTPSSSRVIRGGTMMLTFDIISSLFFTVYMMQLGRAPESDSAMLAIIDTLSIMLRFFAYLGFTGAGSKYMAEYLVRDKKTARTYAMAASKYNFFITGFPLIGLSIILYFTRPTNSIESLAYLTLIIIMIFDRLTSCVSIYILGYQRYDIYSWVVYMPYAGMYVSAMISYPLVGVAGPLISFAFWRVVMFVLSLWGFKKCSDFPLSDVFAWGTHFGLFKKLFTFNFLYSMANLAFSLLTSTLLISGGELLGVLTRQEIVALYTISTFSNILMNIFGIVGPIMMSISEAHSLKNKKLVENYTMLCLKFPIVMTVAVLTFFILFRAEMIEIFYGARWITMGTLIMICLMPAYTTGSFASKYDNILAGMGRPETVIIPWTIALFLGLLGLIIGTILPDTFLIDDIRTVTQVIDGVTLTKDVNYGITLKFAFVLIMNSAGLFVGGIWIVKICLTVLGVKIPKDYLWKPLLVAGFTALCVQILLWLIPFRSFFNTLVGDVAGGIFYTVIMVLIGVFLYITFGLLIDMMNINDGIFWKNIISGMGPIAPLMKPIFWYAKFLLRHQIKWFVRPPIEWVMKTDKATLQKDSQFRVQIIPLTEGHSVSERGVELSAGQDVKFEIIFDQVLRDLKDIIIYARVDFDKISESLISIDQISVGETNKKIMEFKIPPKLIQGTHELLINVEAYDRSRPDKTPIESLNKDGWTFTDFRLRWFHEEQYFIYIS
jgi:O-antigen/teichoic acid export membrane protein